MILWNHYLLMFSSIGFLIPIIRLLSIREPCGIKYALSILFCCNFLFSFLFWYNPIRFSLIHFFDGVFAKVTFFFFSLYVIFIKPIEIIKKNIYISLLNSAIILFYFSDYYSNMDWCSPIHIFFHFLFHSIIIFAGVVVL